MNVTTAELDVNSLFGGHSHASRIPGTDTVSEVRCAID